jgi:hypothetical protein
VHCAEPIRLGGILILDAGLIRSGKEPVRRSVDFSSYQMMTAKYNDGLQKYNTSHPADESAFQ